MKIKYTQLRQSIKLLSVLKYKFFYLFSIFFIYYIFTFFAAFLEGLGMVLIVTLLTLGIENIADTSNNLPIYIIKFIDILNLGSIDFNNLIPIVILIYATNFIIKFSLVTFDGFVAAKLRKELQEKIYIHYILKDWSFSRNLRIGDAINTITYEAWAISKYFSSLISTLHHIISALVLVVLALLTSTHIFLGFISIVMPLAISMHFLVKKQSKLSVKTANLRNEFSADITDRFNGLFQIKTETNISHHIQKGIRSQKPYTRIEIFMGIIQALISSFNLLLPLICLSLLYIWMILTDMENMPNLFSTASILVLGIKLSNHLSGIIASFGQLARLSGSFYPIMKILDHKIEKGKKRIYENINKIYLNNVSHNFNLIDTFRKINIQIDKKKPLIISGPSGAGKTTLANIIAGIYNPSNGDVIYEGGKNKKKFNSSEYLPIIGYITQDIYLFKGTIKENLTSGLRISDKKVLDILKKVGALNFVNSIGGIYSESAEAGRSLSGGQKRRLGIARVLLKKPNILIMDEITSGLDKSNIKSIIKLVEKLCIDHIVIMISHQSVKLPNQTIIRL